ncbi:MAG: prolipoprotein diacylglyceryl transferase [Anaerolineales bacterium]|nr:prolipoprotein diacylglyceryl transferase [Chloroflexota bacterium]MBL6981490.1 prolipoprotein diacylglyceryl transferase [Anaerolineales bacterium]
MDVAFYLPGKVPVYTFSLLIAIGSTLGLFWVTQQSTSKGIRMNFYAGIWSLLGAALVGRAVFISIHWAYFQTHPFEIPQLWLGGITGVGALIGGILAISIFSAISKQNFAQLIDELIPLLTTLTLSAWLGSWINGCMYGPEVHAWWGIPARDEWGEFATRWPLQLIGALLTIFIAWGVDQARGRGWISVPGLAAALQTGGISLTLLWAAASRVDPVPQARNLGLDTWASLGLLILSITGTILILIIQPPKKQTN